MDSNKFSGSSFDEWQEQYHPAAVDSKYVANYITKVYGWMFLALCITAGVALYISNVPALMDAIVSNSLVFFGIIIGQLFLVGFLAVRIQKMSSAVAALVFFVYAVLNGVVFSVILARYSAASIAPVFAITAGTFGVMSAVGYFTKTDLTSFGKIMMMGLIGIIIASIVNIFLGSESLYWIISYVGVAVFVGLIAYDTQKIKGYALLEHEEDRKRGAILGALALYLDFVNLFIYLLRLFGDRR
jgi:FtsH-binding integral membrane protein